MRLTPDDVIAYCMLVGSGVLYLIIVIVGDCIILPWLKRADEKKKDRKQNVT